VLGSGEALPTQPLPFASMAPFRIRTYGDPVLAVPARPVTAFDDDLRRLAEDMLATMYEAPGVGLAAPQVGVQKRLFVYDAGDGPHIVVNPTLTVLEGAWEFEEGCLSVPGLSWPIVRPASVRLEGFDLDANPVAVEGDELLGRVLQHEVDHLDGRLLLTRLSKGDRRRALRDLRNRALDEAAPGTGADVGARGS